MRATYRLNAASPQLPISIPWTAVALFVANPTAAVVLVRVGGQDYPTPASADYRVPANSFLTIPVASTDFGVCFLDASALTDGTGLANLTTAATVTALDASERIPTFGAASFASLSLSDLTAGFVSYSGAQVIGSFDLNAWGGAIVTVLPDSTGGQGVVALTISDDGTTYRTWQTWAIWPGVPVNLTVPRTTRYLRVETNATAISGESAPTGRVHVRATLAEIFYLEYTPTGDGIVKSFVIPGASGTQSYTFVTVGLRAISVAVDRNSGAATSMSVVIEASDLTSGPWKEVEVRTQLTSFETVYRSVGNLGRFTRVTLVDASGLGGLNGTLTLSATPVESVTPIMEWVLRALGDNRQPNSNQSIYHELDTIRQLITLGNASLVDIDNNTDNLETLAGAGNVILQQIEDNTDGVESLLQQIENNTDDAETILNTIHADLVTLDNNTNSLETIETNNGVTLSAINTGISSLDAAINDGNVTAYNGGIALLAGVWTYAGVQVTAGSRVVAIMISDTIAGPNALQIYFGSLASQLTPVAVGLDTININVASNRGSGIPIPANNYVWLNSQLAATVYWTLFVVS